MVLSWDNLGHVEVNNTNGVVGKTCCNFVSILVPAHLKDTTISLVCAHQTAVPNWPYVQALVKRPTCQVLSVRAEGNRVNWIAALSQEKHDRQEKHFQ